MRRDNGYEQRKEQTMREMPPQTSEVSDGGPWRGVAMDHWLARMRRAAGLPTAPTTENPSAD